MPAIFLVVLAILVVIAVGAIILFFSPLWLSMLCVFALAYSRRTATLLTQSVNRPIAAGLVSFRSGLGRFPKPVMVESGVTKLSTQLGKKAASFAVAWGCAISLTIGAILLDPMARLASEHVDLPGGQLRTAVIVADFSIVIGLCVFLSGYDGQQAISAKIKASLEPAIARLEKLISSECATLSRQLDEMRELRHALGLPARANAAEFAIAQLLKTRGDDVLRDGTILTHACRRKSVRDELQQLRDLHSRGKALLAAHLDESLVLANAQQLESWHSALSRFRAAWGAHEQQIQKLQDQEETGAI